MLIDSLPGGRYNLGLFAEFFTMSVLDVGRKAAKENSPVYEQGSEKAAYVRSLFDVIAPRYDLLNGILSAGTHSSWRAFATRCTTLQSGDSVLDVCTGTGEWAALLRECVGPEGTVVAVDFSYRMLRSGDARFCSADVVPIQADAMRLPLESNRFHAATVAFGIRNVVDQSAAFREMVRVLRPGGRLVCVEFSQVKNPAFKVLYAAHSRWVMPAIGRWISGHPSAYAYLPESVAQFKTRTELAAMMREAGLSPVRMVDLMFGLVCVHVGIKADYSVDQPRKERLSCPL